jgi:N-terminal 7TM region of histidine kinase
MSELPGLTWPVILAFGNLILSSAIVITAFSLLGYVLTRNLRNSVAQAFSVLLACVLVVSAGDIVIPRVQTYHAAEIWLRVQWIGIAMVPAAYLHFSDALLRTTRHFSGRRRAIVVASYVTSGVLVFLALFTDALVYNGPFTPPVSQLSAGPLFPAFVAYFALTAIYAIYNVVQARRRCLTPGSRRRMTYLAFSSVAPVLGVFPYLMAPGIATDFDPVLVLLISMVANFVVGTMLVVMAYSVAYYGVLTPDRVIKHDLIHYLLRGPIVGTAVIIVMLVIPRVELILGIPRDTALVFAVVGVIVLGQLAVNAAKPWIDRLIYSQDREEITWIQTLDRRLLTSSDLRQFLTNLLIGISELLRVGTGFVLVQTNEGPRVEAFVGDASAAERFIQSTEWRALSHLDSGDGSGNAAGLRAETASVLQAETASVLRAETASVLRGESPFEESSSTDGTELGFRSVGDYWLCPLKSQDGETMLGLLAVSARSTAVDMDATERAEADMLLAQATAAIADRYVQEGVFATLQSILPDLERIQEWRSVVRYASPSPEPERIAMDALYEEGTWQRWVKDALSHYWGGPKLTESPLAELQVVRRSLRAHDDNIPRALRAVLQQAIDRQRPNGERKLTASEWMIYNILDLRFVQGQRVREIARRLAMSESDLYRKQRAAVAVVAKTLAEMEAAVAEGEEETVPQVGIRSGS